MRVLDLFSGIGGFSLAARWAGMETVAFVEIDPYCQAVLGKNFPGVPVYGDIKSIDARQFRGAVDVVCGTVPRPPASCAGKRRGRQDDRWLWGEAFRVVSEVRPKWCLFENVTGLLVFESGLAFERLLLDLESNGYSVQAFIVPDCSVNAPHRRDRVWIVGCREDVADADEQAESGMRVHAVQGPGLQKSTRGNFGRGWRSTEPGLGLRLDGLPEGVAGWGDGWEDGIPSVAQNVPERVNKLKALGNAIVPQVAYQIFIAIREAEGCG